MNKRLCYANHANLPHSIGIGTMSIIININPFHTNSYHMDAINRIKLTIHSKSIGQHVEKAPN